jgi:hypothetical protein
VAMEAFGDPEAATLESVFADATAAAEHAVRDRQARLRAERSAAQAERDRVAEERDRIASERDDAPPAHPGRTAGRPGRDGVPLWRLVRFADDVGEAQAAALEAALEATGMLDAWITPDDREVSAGDSDGYLVPGVPVPGPSLTGVLVPETLPPEAGTPVPAARVSAVLASISLDGELFSAAAVIGADGRYSHGVTAGAHHKEHAEYIGATARARRRAARIAECETRIAELEELLTAADRTAAGLAETLTALSRSPPHCARTRRPSGSCARPGRAPTAPSPATTSRWPPAPSPSGRCAAPPSTTPSTQTRPTGWRPLPGGSRTLPGISPAAAGRRHGSAAA